MKKIIAFILVSCMLLTSVLLLQTTAYAQDFTLPDDWDLIASDDFTAEDDTSFEAYTGGTGFVSGWTSDIENTSYSFTPNAYIKDGQFYTSNKNQTTNAYRRLEKPIKLTEDADYYIMFDMYSWAGGNNSTNQRFALSDSTNTNNRIHIRTVYIEELACNLPNVEITYGESYTNDKIIPANGIYTFVVQISARSTEMDCIKIRIFTDPDIEAPSFNPQYWDEEYWLDNKPFENLDTIQLATGSGSGSTFNPRWDNIKIYKAAPIFVNHNLSPKSRYLSPNETITITAAEQNLLGNAQAIDSIKWYDATDMSNPVQIASGESYTVTDDMVDKILRAEVVITDLVTGEKTTYYPVARSVHKVFEVTRISVTSKSDRKGRINYTDWSKNSNIFFNAYITRTQSVSGGSARLIVAQYDSNDNLKRTILSSPKKINDITYNKTLSMQVQFTLDHGKEDPNTKNYESGDYFKAFVWYSNQMEFEFDVIEPMHFSTTGDAFENLLVVP